MSNPIESQLENIESDSTMIPRELTLIVAATNKMGIGRANTLPWIGLKKEMAYFARVTKRAPPGVSTNPKVRRSEVLL
jgi:dihydrofolate reductase